MPNWEVNLYMTLVDVFIIATSLYGLRSFIKMRRSELSNSEQSGPIMVLFGFFILGFFYSLDLFSMYVLPYFIPMKEAMAIMKGLHLNYSWVVIGVSVGAIVIGFTRINRVSLVQLKHIQTSNMLLENSETRSSAIINTAGDGIITINYNGIVESFNPAAERIFGYKRADVVGHNINMLMPEDIRNVHDSYLQNYQFNQDNNSEGKSRSLESTGQRQDGSTFPMKLAVSEMNIGGLKMFTGIISDITDRRLAEEAKNQFISTVSHELRTPLTSIKGSLGLVLSGAVGNMPDESSSMISIAYANSDRLILLINDILDIEKMESGELDLVKSPLDAKVLIQDAIEANQGYGNEYGVTFIKGSMDQEVQVQGDMERLMQVLSNLMSNAAKHSSRNSQVELSATRDSDAVRIAVKDEGLGIPEEFRNKIFEKFTQADSSDTRQKGGTGLGLSITKAIVEKHGGALGFDTELGVGSTFYFTLPITE